MHRKSTLLVLFAVLALFATAAQAQLNFQITSTPTQVINIGRAETLGSVRITSISPAGATSAASTIQILFGGVACDNDKGAGNDPNLGVGLNLSGVFVGQVNIASVTNTVTGTGSGPGNVSCIVSLTVPAGLSPAAPNTDYIEVAGVRGRIDLSIASNPNVAIYATLSATPANSSLFTAPNVVQVATSLPGRVFAIKSSTGLLCVAAATSPEIKVTEGFNAAFVQYVTTDSGVAAPVDVRPLAGANRNTQVTIVVSNLQSNVTLTWPDVVAISNGAGTGATLQRMTSISATATTQIYEYATPSQAGSDIKLEEWTIKPVVSVGTGAALGTATASVTLTPPLISGDATALTTTIFGTTTPRPRFNDTPFSGPLLVIAPCTTNLLFPYVATSVAGFDTGIAISNTTSDIWSTPAQAGKCHINYFPAGPGAPIKYDTASVASGDTVTFLTTGNAASAGTVGYIIAVCDFQFAHGLAYLVNSFGQTPNTSIGYLALVIPDPVILAGGTPGTRVPSPSTCSASGLCVTNTGEDLGN